MLKVITKFIIAFLLTNILTACMMQIREDKDQPETEQTKGKMPHYDEAVLAAKDDDPDKAIELFKLVIQTSPDYANAYASLGLQYLQKKDLNLAEQAFDKAISLDATNYVAYNHRGVILRKRGDFEAANEMYQAAIKYNPDYANAHHNIAILYDIYLYDLDKALYHYKKYQSLTGDSDKLVEKWIIDLERQIATMNKQVE